MVGSRTFRAVSSTAATTVRPKLMKWPPRRLPAAIVSPPSVIVHEHGQKIPPIPQLTMPGATSNELLPPPDHPPVATTEPLFQTAHAPSPPLVSTSNGIADAGVASSERDPATRRILNNLIMNKAARGKDKFFH